MALQSYSMLIEMPSQGARPQQVGLEQSRLADNQERLKVLKKKVEKQRHAMGGKTASLQQDTKVSLLSPQHPNS